MKRTLYFIGFLMLSSVIFSPNITSTVRGQDSLIDNSKNPDCQSSSYADLEKCRPYSPSRLFSKINSAITPGGKDWGNVFGSDDLNKIGQDMYAHIYDSTISQPELKAAKNITGKYGTTEAEMAQILYGDFSSILKRKPNLSQEEAMAKMTEIQNKFQEEKDFLQLQADISSAVQPSEMFANGDLSDSGFDLINDLGLIEKILFIKDEPIDVGGDFGSQNDQSSSGGNTGKNSQNTKPDTGASTIVPGSSGNILDGKTPGIGSKNGQNSIDGGVDPNSCLVPGSLDNALAKFDQKSGNKPKPSINNAGQNTNADDGGGSANSDPLPYTEPEISGVQPAPADKWTKDDLCTDVFCLQVKFVEKSPSLYKVSDNCIACHVEKINEKLKETINHNLIPSKATGNLIEPNLCKKAAATSLTSLGLNFYAIAKPVATPQNDDLIYGVGIEDEWKKFVQNSKPFAFDELNAINQSPNGSKIFPQSELDRATSAAISMAPPTSTYQEVSESVQQQLQASAKTREEAMKVATASLQSDVDAGFYQGIQREMDQMNSFFVLYQQILHSLHEPVANVTGSQACSEIKNKKACD